VRSEDSYLKWNIINNNSTCISIFNHNPSSTSVEPYQPDFRAWATQKDGIESLEADMQELKDRMKELVTSFDECQILYIWTP
jgi:hypothetical protein